MNQSLMAFNVMSSLMSRTLSLVDKIAMVLYQKLQVRFICIQLYV